MTHALPGFGLGCFFHLALYHVEQCSFLSSCLVQCVPFRAVFDSTFMLRRCTGFSFEHNYGEEEMQPAVALHDVRSALLCVS
jgi:hypothetical protein